MTLAVVGQRDPQRDLVAAGRVDVVAPRRRTARAARGGAGACSDPGSLPGTSAPYASAHALPKNVHAPSHAGHQARRPRRGCCTPRTTPARWPRCRTGGAAARRSGVRPAPRRPRRRAPGRRRARGCRRRRTTPREPRFHRLGRADDAHAVDSRPGPPAPRRPAVLVRRDGVHADGGEIVDRRAKPDDLRDHRGTRPRTAAAAARTWCFSMVTVSIIDPPVRNGGIAVEQLAAPVQHADPGGAEHLVAGERREVDVERVEVDRLVRHRLAGVQHRQRADRLGPADQFGAPARSRRSRWTGG